MSEFHPELTDQINTKAKIFMAAARLFAEKGYNGVSMREISETTGLSKPTIYYYFGNKEGIYSALIETGLHYQQELFQEIMERSIPIKNKITEVVKLRFKQVHEFPEFAKFFSILFTSFEKLPFLEKFVEEATSRRQMFVDMIKQEIPKGKFGPGVNPEITAEIFVAALIHFILKQLSCKENILSDHLAEEIVDILFRGLND
jgi:TetR/AcrR family transcriptional regulator